MKHVNKISYTTLHNTSLSITQSDNARHGYQSHLYILCRRQYISLPGIRTLCVIYRWELFRRPGEADCSDRWRTSAGNFLSLQISLSLFNTFFFLTDELFDVQVIASA